MAELTFKGVWETCPEYNENDVVINTGTLWKAVQQNAGKKPIDNTPAYWVELTPEEKEDIADDITDPTLKLLKHDETLEIKSMTPGDNWHVCRNTVDAIRNTRHAPNADNPFVTEADLPELTSALAEFETIPMPQNFGVIYDGYFDADTNILCVVADNRIGWYDDKAVKWETQEIRGAWRGVCKHGDKWVAVGTNAVASGGVNSMALGSIRAGKYNDIASSGGRLYAVGDGILSHSDDAMNWQGVETAKGYGDGVCYHEREGKWYFVGADGARTTVDGLSFDDVEGFPSGTHRDIKRGEKGLYSCSGKIHVRQDTTDGDAGEWKTYDVGSGGWNSIDEGEGYIVAVGNGKAVYSKADIIQFKELSIPDYLYTCVVFGYSRFWLLGSTIAVGLVLDIAGAIQGADRPNRTNPFVTKSYVDGRLEDFREETDETIAEKLTAAEDSLKEYNDAKLAETVQEIKDDIADIVPDATDTVAGKVRFATDDEFADGSVEGVVPTLTQVAMKDSEQDAKIVNMQEQINNASDNVGYVYETTGFKVLSVDSPDKILVQGDARAKIKTGDNLLIRDYTYIVTKTEYDSVNGYTTYTMNGSVVNSVLNNDIAKRVRYIAHPENTMHTGDVETVKVPTGGYTADNPPNVSDNFRHMTPESTYALFQYLIHERGDVIGGDEYEDSGETISGVDSGEKNKVTASTITSVLYDKVVVGDYVKLIKDDKPPLIVRVTGIEQGEGGNITLIFDKDIPDEYIGSKIYRQTDASFDDENEDGNKIDDIQAGTNPSNSKIVIKGDPDTLYAQIKVGDKIKIKHPTDDSYTIVSAVEVTKDVDGVTILTDKKVLIGYEGGDVLFERTEVKPTPGKLVESIKVSVVPESISNGETAQARAVISPTDAANSSVKWSLTGDGTIATINQDSGLITANSNSKYGSLGVIATAQDAGAVTGMASFHVKNNISNDVIGIVVIAKTKNGSVLEYIDENYNLTYLDNPKDFFDSHSAYQFTEVTEPNDTYNNVNSHYIKVPIAYWKRGVIPQNKPLAGSFYIMMSPTPKEGFTASPAFMYKGASKDHFCVSKYYAIKYGAEKVIVSLPPSSLNLYDSFATDSFSSAQREISKMGDSHHIMSIYEWQDIAMRIAIEFKNFNFNTIRNNIESDYRGIETIKNTVNYSTVWLNGFKTIGLNAHLWDMDGNWTFVDTGARLERKGDAYVSSQRISEIFTNEQSQYFDHVIIAKKTGYSNGNDERLFTDTQLFEADKAQAYMYTSGLFSLLTSGSSNISRVYTRIAKFDD